MHLLRVLISAFLVFMHCTSVSAVLIKSLNFCFISFWLQSARFSISLRVFFVFTQASLGKPESENANRSLSPKGAHGPRRSMRRPKKLG